MEEVEGGEDGMGEEGGEGESVTLRAMSGTPPGEGEGEEGEGEEEEESDDAEEPTMNGFIDDEAEEEFTDDEDDEESD